MSTTSVLSVILPGYEIHERLGSGGMGEVFRRARQLATERVVAIKLLSPTFESYDGEARQRFEREGRLMAQVTHPNVVTLLDRGSFNGRDYLVMEFVEGTDLRERMVPGRPLDPKLVRPVLGEIVQGLACLHAQDIVHRDLKPENVLLSSIGEVKLTDFGISVPIEEIGALTCTGDVVGTLDYMAPEQRHRLPVDARADQYALAVMTYELLTGRLPLGRFKPASTWNTKLTARTDEALTRALSHDPDERFATVTQFADALNQGIAPAVRRSWRRTAVATAVLLGVVLAAGASYFYWSANLPAAAAASGPEADPPLSQEEQRLQALDLNALYREAEQLLNERRGAEALPHAHEAIRRSPDRPESYALRASCHEQLSQWKEACADWTAAIERDPEKAYFHNRRAVSFARRDQWEAALADYTRQIELTPGRPASYVDRADCHMMLQLPELARRDLDQAVEIAPGSPVGCFYRGVFRHRFGDEKGACEDLEEAVRLGTDQPVDVHRLLALLRMHPKDRSLRDIPKALVHARRAVEATQEQSWEFLCLLAEAHGENGDLAAVNAWGRKALAVAPPHEHQRVRDFLESYRQRTPDYRLPASPP